MLYYNYMEINHFALLDNPVLIYRPIHTEVNNPIAFTYICHTSMHII